MLYKINSFLILSTYFSFVVACGGGSSISDSTNQGSITAATGQVVPPDSEGQGSGSGSDGQTTSSSSSSIGPSTTDGESTGNIPCLKGTVVCDGNTAMTCDGNGGFINTTECVNVCAEQLGCVLCVPGTGSCAGNTPFVCNVKGDAWVEQPTCDPVQGMVCNPELGRCDGPCANVNEFSYIGCDYYSTNLPSVLSNSYKFGVAVANTTSTDATITVTRGDLEILKTQVKANDVAVIPLSKIQYYIDQSPTILDGSYRIRTTRPVTVYQYNPLIEDDDNIPIPPSTEASLLLPTNVWGKDYFVVTRKHWVTNNYSEPGFFTVIAKEDSTTVSFTPRTNFTGEIMQGPGVNTDGSGQVVLSQGDTLHVFSNFVDNIAADLTGTRILSDRPIEVFSGHNKTFLPEPYEQADNLEESLLPTSAFASEYIVVPPPGTKENDPPYRKNRPQIVQLMAAEENVILHFEPPQAVKATPLNTGEFKEIELTNQAFRVWSEEKKKFAVVQYMTGYNTSFAYIDDQPPEKVYEGDPAMLITVPTAQYRRDYLFLAHTHWPANYVDVIAPISANVKVDGALINDGWQPVTNQYRFVHVKLLNEGNGIHRVESDKNVGISVSSVKNSASFWFPGGLNVLTIE